MKRRGLILFNIIFFLAVFLNIGLATHANFSFQYYATEVTAGTDTSENYLGSGNDSTIDDEIAQAYNNVLTIEPIDLITISQNCPPIKNFSFSVWQPPKLL